MNLTQTQSLRTETPKSSAPESVRRFDRFLTRIIDHSGIHAKFLNTLSLLEYMGCRKILKSQRAESISAEILAHTAEEIRHAQVFKKLALKMSQGQLTTYAEDHLLCGAEASRYFQTIDQSAFAQLQGTDTPDPDRSLNYVVTTLLIEERANRIYPFYEELLSRVGFSGYLKAIVREETGHLQDITTQILENESLTPELLNTLRQSEDEAFTQFTQSLEQELERQLTIAS